MESRFVCYYQPEKAKSQRVLEAFAAGCDARMVTVHERELLPGVAVFYGVRPGWAHLWEQAKAERRDWIYVDNAYFDCCRDVYYRVTKNAIQHDGLGASDGARFRALGIDIKPMREGGDYDLICQQSDEFMRVVANDPGFVDRVALRLREMGHEVVIRRKGEKRPLADDLKGARRLWTWSSAAAVTALIEGVPVTTMGPCCAHSCRPDDRERWAGVLADNQWSLSEIRSGLAWRALNG